MSGAAKLIELAYRQKAPPEQDVARIIKETLDIDAPDADGWTALQHACLRGHTDMALALVKAGADLNRANPHGLLPATIAALDSSEFGDVGQYTSFVTLLQLGSHFPELEASYPYSKTPSSPTNHMMALQKHGIIYQRTVWFSGCHQAWTDWAEKEGRNIATLTPKRLLQFTSIHTIDGALDPVLWRGHEEALCKLLSSPGIPPCHIQTWLADMPGLAELIRTPRQRINIGDASVEQSAKPNITRVL